MSISKSKITPPDNRDIKELPVRVLQFGTGNFLRAFIDWMIDEMSRNGQFNGLVTMIQSTNGTTTERLESQGNRYSLMLRGIQNGLPTSKLSTVESIKNGINANTHFSQLLKSVENPDLRLIFSNTTEAGFDYSDQESQNDFPPPSFPTKLLLLIRHRYEFFNGAQDKGFLIFPCELIESNGDKLKEILGNIAKCWYPSDLNFHSWLNDANVTFNTLVDRIVSGFPAQEAADISQKIGFKDQLITVGEPFHFMAIEGPIEYEREFPIVSAGFNVKWCNDISPYKTQKVRILNGGHTMTVLAAHLSGLTTVEDCTKDPLFKAMMHQGIFDEIIPTMNFPKEELHSFGEAVLERFQNPHLDHQLLSISLNSVSKWKERVLPTLIDYQTKYGKLPKILSFSLVALTLFYRGRSTEDDGSLKGTRAIDGQDYNIKDSDHILEWFKHNWSAFDENDANACNHMMSQVLAQTTFWGADLNKIPLFTTTTAAMLTDAITNGVKNTVNRIVSQQEDIDSTSTN
jgi:tagaturonate reductase